MGHFFLPLILLFCFAIIATQAWLSHPQFDRTTYGWIAMSFLGLIAAYFSAVVIAFSLTSIFRLDILQNAQQATIAVIPAAIVFVVILSLSQWLVLRESVSRPILQAALNIILGMVTWVLLNPRIIAYKNIALGLPLFVVLLAVLGVGLGGIIHKFLNS